MASVPNRSDGGRGRVKATYSSCGAASFWSLALSAADRFKCPPAARGVGGGGGGGDVRE